MYCIVRLASRNETVADWEKEHPDLNKKKSFLFLNCFTESNFFALCLFSSVNSSLIVLWRKLKWHPFIRLPSLSTDFKSLNLKKWDFLIYSVPLHLPAKKQGGIINFNIPLFYLKYIQKCFLKMV